MNQRKRTQEVQKSFMPPLRRERESMRFDKTFSREMDYTDTNSIKKYLSEYEKCKFLNLEILIFLKRESS